MAVDTMQTCEVLFFVQTVRIEMALANGTLANFTKDSNPILWHAVQVGTLLMHAMLRIVILNKAHHLYVRGKAVSAAGSSRS